MLKCPKKNSYPSFNFESTGAPWIVHFGTKSLTASNQLDAGHTFIATIDDLGNAGEFKTSPNETQIQFNNDLLIYPNPAEHYVTIKCKETIKSYRLLGINGNVLLQGDASNANGFILQLNDVVNGMYLLEVTTEGNRYVEKIIVKQ